VLFPHDSDAFSAGFLPSTNSRSDWAEKNAPSPDSDRADCSFFCQFLDCPLAHADHKGHGFPRRIYAWLDKDYGTAAASLIRTNPYILTKYRGVGFELADKVYQQLGLSPTALLRQWNYLVYLVASDTNEE